MSELSGSQWCARFPGSRSVNDLAVPFRNSVVAFLNALHKADPPATVVINATLRPPERAYLMHYAWLIAHDQIQPPAVPNMNGVDIIWDHPNAVSAAQQMVHTYRMAFVAALESDHTRGVAIDMDITWSGTLHIKEADGATRTISTGPRDNNNPELQAVGRSYGVLKLISDPPHWSVDGH